MLALHTGVSYSKDELGPLFPKLFASGLLTAIADRGSVYWRYRSPEAVRAAKAAKNGSLVTKRQYIFPKTKTREHTIREGAKKLRKGERYNEEQLCAIFPDAKWATIRRSYMTEMRKMGFDLWFDHRTRTYLCGEKPPPVGKKQYGAARKTLDGILALYRDRLKPNTLYKQIDLEQMANCTWRTQVNYHFKELRKAGINLRYDKKRKAYRLVEQEATGAHLELGSPS